MLGLHPSDEFPCVVVVFSGKRKSGKDYITDILLERCVDVEIIMGCRILFVLMS